MGSTEHLIMALAEKLIADLAPSDLAADRPVERIDWPGPVSPRRVWRTCRQWQGIPDEGAMRTAIREAYSAPENFVVCRYCEKDGRKARVQTGHAEEDGCCHRCAQEYRGIIY